jgi:uncharacterized membrane protein YqgA involved in biofilm formation
MTSVGAMAVNGAILDATGDPGILIAKSVIDAIACFIMASSLGIGCAFSAIIDSKIKHPALSAPKRRIL